MPGRLGGGLGGAPPKYYLVYMPTVGRPRHPHQQHWGNRPQYQLQ
jgi:hypothetical protein